MKKIIFSLLLIFYCAFLSAQNTGSLPYWSVMLPKSSISGTDSCAVFDHATLKWKKINCAAINKLYLPLAGNNNSTTQMTGNIYMGSGLGIYFDSSTTRTHVTGDETDIDISTQFESLHLYSNATVFTDANASTRGIQYASDYSADFVARSLIDKGYADGKYIPLTGSSAITGDLYFNVDGFGTGRDVNNFTEYSSDFTFVRGGSTGLYSQVVFQPDIANCQLSSTDISNSANNRVFEFNPSLPFQFIGADARYDADYSASYTSRSLVDKAYVDSHSGVSPPFNVNTQIVADSNIIINAPDSVSNNNIVSIGVGNYHSGLNSVTYGIGNHTTNQFTTNVGQYNKVTGYEDICLGLEDTISGANSVAVGENINISGSQSYAVGQFLNVTSDFSYAIGVGADGLPGLLNHTNSFGIFCSHSVPSIYISYENNGVQFHPKFIGGQYDTCTAAVDIENQFAGSGTSASGFSTFRLRPANLPSTFHAGEINVDAQSSNRLKFYDGSTNRSIAYTSDILAGTVTSVAVTAPTSLFSSTGSPITSSGTIAFTLQNQSQGFSFMGPATGGSGTPAFRAIVATDIPTLNQNTTGTAANITGTSNSTLVTASALSLPFSQVSGTGSLITNSTSAGGDLAGTYPNPTITWANGETTYNGQYVQLTDNSIQTLTGSLAASTGTGTVFDYNHTLTMSGTSTGGHLFGLSPTLVAGVNNNTLTNLFLNATYTNGSFTGVNNWAVNANTGSIKVNSGFVELNTISTPVTPASGLVDIYSNSGVPSWIQSDGTVRAVAATNVNNSFSAIQTFSSGLNSNLLNTISSGFTLTPVANTGTNVSGFSNSYFAGLGTGIGVESYHAFYSPIRAVTGTTAQTNIAKPLIIGTIPATTGIGLWFGIAPGSQTSANASIYFSSLGGTLNINQSNTFSAGTNFQWNGANQLVIASGVTVATTLNITGATVAMSPVSCANFLSQGSGTNVLLGGQDQLTNPNLAGGNVTVQAGKGTGTGTPSQVIIQAPLLGSSSSTLQTLSTIATFDATVKGFNLIGNFTIPKANNRAGTSTLVAGTTTVTNTTVTANTKVKIQLATTGGTLGAMYTYSVSAGASFTITSVTAAGATQALDTSVLDWILIENP